MSAIIIQNEQDAYDLLRKLYHEEVGDVSQLNLEFSGWPQINVRLTGENYKSTITPSIMKAFLKLQDGLYQAYAVALYGKNKRLSDQEKQSLELVIKVGTGSSKFDDNENINWTSLFGRLIDKMPSKYLLIALLTGIIMYFGESYQHNYYENLKHERETQVKSEHEKNLLDAMKLQSELSREAIKENTALVKQVLDFYPLLQEVAIKVNETKEEFLKQAANTGADSIELQGTKLSGEQAKILGNKPRTISELEPIKLDGMYRILTVNTEVKSGFKVKIRNEISGIELLAEVKDTTFDSKFKQAIENGTFEKRPVELVINAQQNKKTGSISEAVINKAVLRAK
ncbi:hypothetical protein FHQ26_01500 [Testudinibacter sp. TR-2022]|uniref:hypothetical protein n=1 Tax=Testudinibacter sp. TR-2022 TaxID=2585029 RepID=UPI001117D5A1|nr:hypothetical protein [Testudinibacter sp. TR-2022]TNH04505.1 hypothetical protein FHQ22_04515 [Pasteurellaceae bacterium Phil31]TNH11973.1 hypothetical protein FHQ25_01420 [Testudinibacter sp. TR-2022]TNH12722.1 hypothetical protein FHQ26_01500 [Testudinibacter sp. TR-2022]TNH13685.1 hypothetical protein FIA56_06545 [Testudinibacter sp. TR-2022]TNH17233.1 hypothetical protein FHQ23_07265 [Testudinibacter sp. TR-2022]